MNYFVLAVTDFLSDSLLELQKPFLDFSPIFSLSHLHFQQLMITGVSPCHSSEFSFWGRVEGFFHGFKESHGHIKIASDEIFCFC